MTSNPSAKAITGEDLQKLVTNGKQMAHNILVNKTSNKASNNDLIDLIDENKDVLQLFDPLLMDLNLNPSQNNNLNFSNNFELDSDSNTSSVNDEVDKSTEDLSPSVSHFFEFV